MHVYDVLAVLLLVSTAAAFMMGSGALARSEDLTALYWLLVGLVTMRAAVQIAKSGVRS